MGEFRGYSSKTIKNMSQIKEPAKMAITRFINEEVTQICAQRYYNRLKKMFFCRVVLPTMLAEEIDNFAEKLNKAFVSAIKELYKVKNDC